MTQKRNLRKWLSVVEMMAAGALLLVIIVVSMFAMWKFKNIISGASALSLTPWVALTQINQGDLQKFTAGWQPVTVWVIAPYKLYWGTNTLDVKFDKTNQPNVDTAVKAWDPILVVAVNKSPYWTGDTHTHNSVSIDYSAADNATWSIEQIANNNSQNWNALRITEVSIATDKPLSIGETKGWVIKPVGTTNFNWGDEADSHSYKYRYAIWK